jgi:hypothetical protein
MEDATTSRVPQAYRAIQKISAYITETISTFAKGMLKPSQSLRQRVQTLGSRFGGN